MNTRSQALLLIVLLVVASLVIWLNWDKIQSSLIWMGGHFWASLSLPRDQSGAIITNILGGSGFVELCTGFNIALVSVREFRERLRFTETEFANFSSSRASSILDATLKSRAQSLYANVTGYWKKLNEMLWKICFFLTFITTIIGTWMLYINRFCVHSWALLLPFTLYFAWMATSLLLLSLFTKIVSGVCNLVTKASPKQEIQALDSKSKHDVS